MSGALRPLERIWSAAVSIDVADDPAIIREMALAGCTGVFIGFESLNDRNIQEQRKRSPQTTEYARRVALFHDHGIQVNGSFVLGFDHDGYCPVVPERVWRAIGLNTQVDRPATGPGVYEALAAIFSSAIMEAHNCV